MGYVLDFVIDATMYIILLYIGVAIGVNKSFLWLGAMIFVFANTSIYRNRERRVIE